MPLYISNLISNVKESAAANMKIFNKYVNKSAFSSNDLEMDFDDLAYKIKNSKEEPKDDE
jgi:hypothetical protein